MELTEIDVLGFSLGGYVTVAAGDDDTLMITENSPLSARHLPNAQLGIPPDAGHGSLNQYPAQFADHVRAFLNGG